ncbi:MAG: FkbM family methyltransferase [Blastocatellia bacterium]
MGKIATAVRVLESDGLAGIGAVFREKYINARAQVMKWQQEDNWWLGRLVELCGNVVRVDGLSFSVAAPQLMTSQKAQFLQNRYELPERVAIRQYFDPELPVVEFGAAIGVVSCLINRKLQHPKQHVVVEANPSLMPVLEENRRRNRCQFTVLERAVAYGTPEVTFNINRNCFLASNAMADMPAEAYEQISVPAITLREIIEAHQFDRCTLICDIEGGEADLLRYEGDLIRERVSTIIMEVHAWTLGQQGYDDVIKGIRRLGFCEVFSMWSTFVFIKDRA